MFQPGTYQDGVLGTATQPGSYHDGSLGILAQPGAYNDGTLGLDPSGAAAAAAQAAASAAAARAQADWRRRRLMAARAAYMRNPYEFMRPVSGLGFLDTVPTWAKVAGGVAIAAGVVYLVKR